MRIGIITNLIDSDNAGIGRYTENLVTNLLRIDKKNEYILIHSNKRTYDFHGNYKEIRLPFFTSIPHKFITGFICLERICQEEKLDILHDMGQIGPYFFKSKTKRILTIFDLSLFHYPEVFTNLTKFYYKFLPTIIKNIDRVITISQSSKKDIIKYLNLSSDKIEVTYLGVEKQFVKSNNKKLLEKKRIELKLPSEFILFVGTIEPRKNIPLLITSFAKLKKETNNNIKLVIAGKFGWEKKDTINLPEKLGIKEEVIFLGKVEEKILPTLYILATVFVYPSLYEGFGLPVLEAMACGCPVITSRISSMPEIAKNAVIYINPHKEKELTNSMKDVIINKNLGKKLSKYGIIQAKNFNWKKCAMETLKIYEKIL